MKARSYRQRVIVFLLNESALKEMIYKLALPVQNSERHQLGLHGTRHLQSIIHVVQ